MSNNHLSDDDDEFLYGTSETAPMSNNPLNSRLDVDDLYELYDDMDTKDKETDMEEERIEDADKEKKVTEDTEETDTTVVEIQKAENTVENEEEEESDDDLEIILEPEEESHQEPETEQHNGDKSSTVENKDTPVNIKPGQQGKPSSTPTANASSQPTNTKTAQGGINLEAVGEYNGQQITEVDLDSVEDKPWRKPGADITDYFNYGFNENTWRSYCAKQKMLRDKKIMSDIDMGDFMSMGMMMPPNMMDGAMPMGMGGMPAPMMGLPMGLPNSVNNPAGSAGIRAVRNANFNPRGPGRSNMPMGRSKTSDKEREGDMMNAMEGGMSMEDGMFSMDFPGGPGNMPMNMFPPEMASGPMGMPFFNPNMAGVPMGFEGGDFRGSGGRPPMRNMGRSPASRNQNSGSNNINNNSSSNNNSGEGSSSSGWRGSSGGGGGDDSSEHRSDSRKRQMGSSGSSSSNQDDHYKRSRR